MSLKHDIYMSLLWVLPNKIANKILYRRSTGKKLDLDSPIDLNEKIQWLILNKYGKDEARLADKLLVKDFVRKKNIRGLLVPKTLKIYHNVNDIDLNKLPERFVLKCNHGSGRVFICKDKKHFDIESVKRELARELKKNYAKVGLEYHYSLIEPVVIAEEYLDDGVHKNPIDYKFYCFDGKVESILVCSNRENELKLNDFDLDWNELDYTLKKYRSSEKLEKPTALKEMIRIAEELSRGMIFVRVDLYEINGRVYFGEYTFTPAAGTIYYYKPEALKYLGDKIILEKDN